MSNNNADVVQNSHGGFTITKHCPGARLAVIDNGDYTSIRFHCIEHPSIQQVFQRAVDKWPDAPPEIKWLADIITNGKPMQDYFGNPNLAGPVTP